MVPDETLYHNFINGDENALRELMERYENMLTLYIAGIIHDIHDAEDLMLDTFMRLVIKKPQIWDNCFKSYLYKTGRNIAFRFMQKKRFNVCFGFDDIESEPKNNELIHKALNDEERNRVLHMCIKQLHSDYGEALFLHYIEGLSCKKTAVIMEKSEKQINDLVYRGKQSLKKILIKEGINNSYNE